MRKLINLFFVASIGICSVLLAAPPMGADEQLRRELGYPPKINDFYFELSNEKAPWTYRLGLFEGAEEYLGTELFMELPKKFAEIHGVKKVFQEDREWYLIQSDGLSKNQIRKELWSKFLQVANKSFVVKKAR